MVNTDTFKQWAVGLIICALGGTVISLLSPRGSMEKTLRAVIGIFVVSAVCTPLVELKKADSFLPAFAAQSLPAIEAENLREQIEEACKSTAGRVIDEVMKSAGISNYEAAVNVHMNEEYCIIIQDIQIKIDSENIGSAAKIQAALQQKLNVKVNVICE